MKIERKRERQSDRERERESEREGVRERERDREEERIASFKDKKVMFKTRLHFSTPTLRIDKRYFE